MGALELTCNTMEHRPEPPPDSRVKPRYQLWRIPLAAVLVGLANHCAEHPQWGMMPRTACIVGACAIAMGRWGVLVGAIIASTVNATMEVAFGPEK